VIHLLEGDTPSELQIGTHSISSSQVNWSATSDVAWMDPMNGSGQTPDPLYVSFETGALTPGIYSGILTIQSPNHQEEVAVSLTVYERRMEVSPGSLDFGQCLVGSTTEQTYVIYNPMELGQQIAVSSDNPYFVPSETDLYCDAHHSVTVTVSFVSQRLGADTGTFTLTPAGKSSSPTTIMVAGEGVLQEQLGDTITFDPPTRLGESINISTYTEKNFRFSVAGFIQHIDTGVSYAPDNGSAHLCIIVPGGTPIITNMLGSVFDAIRVDLAEGTSFPSYRHHISFVGTKPDGSKVTTRFVTDGVAGGFGGVTVFEKFEFPATFTNLISLEISPVASVDNLVLNATRGQFPVAQYVAWQNHHFPAKSARTGIDEDFDGDGQSNREEFIAGTDPVSPSSFFQVAPANELTNGSVISWESVTGRVYSVWWKNCLGKSFQPLETGISYPQNSYTDMVHSAEGCGFYKIDVELDPATSD
jgi:hypothetical protein